MGLLPRRILRRQAGEARPDKNQKRTARRIQRQVTLKFEFALPFPPWMAYTLDKNMTFSEFTSLAIENPDGVVLLEGRRAIPDDYAKRAHEIAASLASRFPTLRFRSGNAEGSDEAFSRGVAEVDSGRLQVIVPYTSHRKSVRHADAIYESPESLSAVQEDEIACKTSVASPKNKGLVSKRNQKGPLATKAAYLIRDTMKVTGHSEEFPKPVCALFYVSMDDPYAGGTGHTIRVCQQEGVPFVFQDSWATWPKR